MRGVDADIMYQRVEHSGVDVKAEVGGGEGQREAAGTELCGLHGEGKDGVAERGEIAYRRQRCCKARPR